MTEIKKDPYNYICDYVESVYPKTGRRVFEILALMPCSLIIPDMEADGKKTRSNIHAMFLAPPASGKTSLSDLFSNITYSPLKVESITPARLESEIEKNRVFSLIVGDFARLSRDPVIIKVIEGLLGEEKRINRKTMRTNIDIEAEGIALLCGVATDLHFYILGGLIFRVVPILISHDSNEHSEIGKHITAGLFENAEKKNSEELIKNYYAELASIQDGEHKDIKPIIGYHVPKEFKDKIQKRWDEITRPIVQEIGFMWVRELQEAFRFLCASAFLNIFNREVKNGILYPNESDLKLAIKLMTRTIIFKYRLMKSERMAKGLQSAKEFDSIMKSDKIPEETKNILRNIVKIKNGKMY